MQLVTITRVKATNTPAVLICHCTVEHPGGEIEQDVLCSYSSGDPYMEDFNTSVGQWLLANQGQYAIEPYDDTPVYDPGTPVLSHIANLQIMDGDVSAIDLSVGFTAIFAIEPGLLWAFFETPMPDMAYSWNVNSTQGRVSISDRTLDYIEVEAKDDNGEPLAAGVIALQIFKVNP